MFAKEKRVRIAIPTARKLRATNIASLSMPMKKSSNKSEKNAIFHTSHSGSVLMLLNHLNQPVKAWTNVHGFMPHTATFVDKSRFRSILKTLNPVTLYCNNGEPIKPIDEFNVVMYTGKSLDTLLNEIEVKEVKEDKHSVKIQDVPSYETMKSMDSGMTRKEYEAFCAKYNKFQS